MSDENTEAVAIANLANAAHGLRIASGKNGFVLVPEGWSVESVEALQDRPNRIRSVRVFGDVSSLVAYLKRYQTPENLFVVSSPKTGDIAAILDYHDPACPLEAAKPMWGEHKASFKAQFTPQYEAWRKLHRKTIGQTEAGEFLEDRLGDITHPVGADVMEMVMQFDALKKVSFSQATRLRDGNVQVTYVEDTEARGALTIPDHIALLVPVYEGMEPETILVRLRFRVVEQRLSFIFVIANIEDLERQAFRRCEDAFVTEMNGCVTLHSI